MNAGRPWGRLCLALSVGWCACGDDDDGATATEVTGQVDASGSGGTEPTRGPSTSGVASGSSASPGGEDSTVGDASDSGSIDPTAPGELLDGLVALDAVSDPAVLWSLDPTTGMATARCSFVPGNVYNSLAFGPGGRLFAHNLTRNRIERFDPCDCGFESVGQTGLGRLEVSSGVDDETLVGVDLGLDAFVTINPRTGLSTLVGPLGIELEEGGLAAGGGALWLVDATSDQLHSLDPTTGETSLAGSLGQNLSTAGVAASASADDALWVCSGPSLFSLSLGDTRLDLVGATGMAGDCVALAALPSAIECP